MHLSQETCIWLIFGAFVGGGILMLILSVLINNAKKRADAEDKRRAEHRDMYEFIYGIDRWHSRADRNPNSLLARLLVIEEKLNIEQKKDNGVF